MARLDKGYIEQKEVMPVALYADNGSGVSVGVTVSMLGGSGGSGGDASAANQATEIARLQSIITALGPLSTEATLAAITPKLEQMRLILVDSLNGNVHTHALSITPNDTTDLTITCLAVSVNFDGNVKMRLSGDAGGADVVVYLRAGVLYPLTASRIYATGTTATGIVLWR